MSLVKHLFGCIRKAACQRDAEGWPGSSIKIAAHNARNARTQRSPSYGGSAVEYSYVGQGAGSFIPRSDFEYAGRGNGDFGMVTEVQHAGYRVRPCCKGFALCLTIVVVGLAGFLCVSRTRFAMPAHSWGRHQAVSVVPRNERAPAETVAATIAGVTPTAPPAAPAAPAAAAAPAVLPTTGTTSAPYDCQDLYSSWSSDKKDYCCAKFSLGCDKVTAAAAESTEAKGCDSTCSIAGSSATCRARVHNETRHAFEGHRFACVAAHAHVMQKCSAACSGCSLEDVGCRLTEENPAASTSKAPAQSPGCDIECNLGGHKATCAAHIQHNVDHVFKGKPSNACLAAHGAVLRHCPVCNSCQLSDAKCSPPSAPEAHEPAPAGGAKGSDASGGYDCAAERENWQQDWSPLKKGWCCKHEQIGCTDAEADAASPQQQPDREYECTEGDHYEWSAGKKAWCCLNHHIHCPSDAAVQIPTNEGCAATCTVDGVQATCKTRILYNLKNTFAGHTQACEAARSMTLKSCPGCSGCNLADAGCPQPVA